MNFKEEYTDRVEKIEKILKKYLPEKKDIRGRSWRPWSIV